jgi:predicted NBD/HSP70 family sugar kinase
MTRLLLYLASIIFGAGKNSKRLLMVTLGTGIGVALLDNGKPFRTSDGQHPEAGHIPVSGNQQLVIAVYEGVGKCLRQEHGSSKT